MNLTNEQVSHEAPNDLLELLVALRAMNFMLGFTYEPHPSLAEINAKARSLSEDWQLRRDQLGSNVWGDEQEISRESVSWWLQFVGFAIGILQTEVRKAGSEEEKTKAQADFERSFMSPDLNPAILQIQQGGLELLAHLSNALFDVEFTHLQRDYCNEHGVDSFANLPEEVRYRCVQEAKHKMEMQLDKWGDMLLYVYIPLGLSLALETMKDDMRSLILQSN